MNRSPNGNGGLWSTLVRTGILKQMKEQRGLKHLQVFGVDNILVKVRDPLWFGHCLQRQVDVSNKTCTKSHPHEKIGVMCLRNGEPSVVECSEITKEMAEARHARSGDLIYGCGNIAMHCFSVDLAGERAMEAHPNSDTLKSPL